jgi:hypothetical protein
MNLHFENLISQKVSSVQRDTEALTVVFGDAYVLAVFNRLDLEDTSNHAETDASLIVGKMLLSIQQCSESTAFDFEGSQLDIELRDAAWTGPEAAVLYERGVPVVVW